MTRSQAAALDAIRTHFRDTGCSPSMGDLGRLLNVSRSRAHRLVGQLTDAGLIRRRSGVALSIRMPRFLANFSDDDLINRAWEIMVELADRGLIALGGERALAATPVKIC